MNSVEVWKMYTDGAWRPKLQRGSWGAFMVNASQLSYATYGSQSDTTSNRMEMMGAIAGYQFFKQQRPAPCYLRIYTDSQYLYLGVTQYLSRWRQAEQWRTTARKPVKNQDLWREIISMLASHDTISWRWISRTKNSRAHLLAEQGLGLAV